MSFFILSVTTSSFFSMLLLDLSLCFSLTPWNTALAYTQKSSNSVLEKYIKVMQHINETRSLKSTKVSEGAVEKNNKGFRKKHKSRIYCQCPGGRQHGSLQHVQLSAQVNNLRIRMKALIIRINHILYLRELGKV